ncbi:hypothetical protein [Roseofilum casamattae]|uniref:Secreted protein n=1 Tax=Roseofilum casamattae BLCC-M143 TaxID=3022442 RepID=A0ABT7BZF3_9CYAN|nr:hypothetical protein [Roseofilum casamattae]MDJ1184586.1 hypothetical protein [Roseofilum casamattae BLCC-M143]
MYKFVILILAAFTLSLWTALLPAQAQAPDRSQSVTYTWGYDRLGGTTVCKQVTSTATLDPRYPDKPSLQINARAVDSSYCAR